MPAPVLPGELYPGPDALLFIPIIVGGIFAAILAVISAIVSGFNLVKGLILDVVRVVGPMIRDAVGIVAKAADVLRKWLTGFALQVAKWSTQIWEVILRPVWEVFRKWFAAMRTWLRDTLQPVFKILDKIQEVLDWVFDRIIAPVLLAIQKVRLVLQGLEKLGLSFAGKLDDFLGGIQTLIRESFGKVVETLNRVTFFLDSLLTPFGWIQGRPFLLSVQRWSGGLASIMVGLGLPPDLDLSLDKVERELRPKGFNGALEDFASGELAGSSSVQDALARFRRGAGSAPTGT